jgi:hypothetical protein
VNPLRKGECLNVVYDGYSRVVEVHAEGETKKRDQVVRVWQVRGGSASNEPMGWKLLRLDEALSFHFPRSSGFEGKRLW